MYSQKGTDEEKIKMTNFIFSNLHVLVLDSAKPSIKIVISFT